MTPYPGDWLIILVLLAASGWAIPTLIRQYRDEHGADPWTVEWRDWDGPDGGGDGR